MGINKWKALGRHYSLEHVIPPAEKELSRSGNIFAQYGLCVVKT
ncbi:MAG: hypothetical protein Q7J67_06345 [bacterium]|nr:hypothetical protein [bacterium]